LEKAESRRSLSFKKISRGFTMNAAELGRFVREEVPQWKLDAEWPSLHADQDSGRIIAMAAALDCAMELLREIASDLDWALDYVPEGMSRKNQAEPAKLRECRKRLATLRLVLGEGGEGEK
jgi:hypothetical protein